MAIRYYDDAVVYRLKKWIPSEAKLRVLRPNETKRLFETKAADSGDKPLRLPFVAVSRDDDLELLLNVKNSRSFDGLKFYGNAEKTAQWNVIPIRLQYQLDIYTKTADDGDEYMRNFLFKLVNNPTIEIEIPYNDSRISHLANIRVLSPVSNTSDVSERLFAGQFSRWSIRFEIQDAFLFSIPYRNNWKIDGVSVEVIDDLTDDVVESDYVDTEGLGTWLGNS